MATLQRRYSPDELKILTMRVYAEEDRPKYAALKWPGYGFRWYRSTNVVCIEHYLPRPSTQPTPPKWKPAA
jgi:hypothetical protein